MRIFGGTFRSTVSAPNKPDTVTIENWRSIQLDIQVCFPSSFFHHIPVTDIGILKKHESVHAVEDALLRIRHLQPVQLSQSGFGEASRKLLVEVLPPVLVLHLKRFVYDASANDVVKINKLVQFAPELGIPLGTVFCFVFLVLSKTKCLGQSRNHGAHRREICGACTLQASWGALSPFTTASPRAAETIRSMCSTRMKAVVVGKLGYTSTMNL